jgi:MSHA biogenesis protein MshP
MTHIPIPNRRQRGSALVIALFLIVVVGALGVFAVRSQTDQTQRGNLQLIRYRAAAAAQSGLEYWSYQVAANNNIACPISPLSLSFGNTTGLNGFSVTISCVRIVTGSNAVYEVTATGRNSASYGTADFVQRTITRRISTATNVY